MKFPISGSQFGFDGLDCPSCGGNYLHHEGLIYYNRKEDEEYGDLISIQGAVVNEKISFISTHISNASMKECPSPRKGGMTIIFSCECCPAKPELSIYQHKGQTFIEWANTPTLSKETKRQSIKPSLRFEIFKRDSYCCQMCGATAKEGANLEIDHIHPVSKGGTNDADNLQVLCRDCNAGKSDQWQ